MLEPGEYIDVKFPFFYKAAFLVILALALVVFVLGIAVSLLFDMPLLGERIETFFVLCGTISFFLTVIAGGMLVIGITVFPKVVRKNGA